MNLAETLKEAGAYIICDHSTFCKIKDYKLKAIWIDGFKGNQDNRELIIKTFKESL